MVQMELEACKAYPWVREERTDFSEQSFIRRLGLAILRFFSHSLIVALVASGHRETWKHVRKVHFWLLPLSWSIRLSQYCVCVCTHVGVSTCTCVRYACVCVCLCVSVEARGSLWVSFLRSHPPWLLTQGLSLGPFLGLSTSWTYRHLAMKQNHL